MENNPTTRQTPPAHSSKTWKERIKGINKLFAITVVLPTAIGILYYGLIASDVYVSESRFVVRSARQQTQTSVVGALLQGTGFSQAPDDTYPVIDYIQSRDALRILNTNDYIRNTYAKEGDFIDRFRTLYDGSFEALWKYYGKNVVTVTLDPTSSITTLQTRSYSAKGAELINSRLITISEELVNKLNARAARDTIQFAQNQVDLAAEKSKGAGAALAAYRSSHTVFDPDKQSALQLQQVTALQTQLFAAQSQLIQLRTASSENPQIPVLTSFIETIKKQIQSATGDVTGGRDSLAQKAAAYERLQLGSDFADKQLAAAMTALQSAHAEAEKKQLYLEVLVQPNTPDIAVEPERIRGIFAVFCVGLISWAVLSLLIASIREHRD
ncbi:hypothetical protein [Burkholderia sp. PAMC 26561]|uniref:hypothetical protein n=1 Tax=Burkholderia sp. PAMC 26561 TaxID=1795043 RepID=UPI00076B099D|nr:hypothetical protein [Burkholderia sp. PAMC 26561]AME22901.1 hypothetical protein AXG89_02720 [Burkholderia sp. PAMC 26561]